MSDQLLSVGKAAKIIGVSIKTLQRWDKNGKFVPLRLGNRGNRYYKQSDINLFINDMTAIAKKWAINSVPYKPNPSDYCETRDIFQARLEHYKSELTRSLNDTMSSLVTAISGEIGNNSFDHNLGNWPDIMGIYFSYSISQKKVVLADRGLGILTTLRKVRPHLINSEVALKVAFTETISGRAPESRGNGLKFVRNVIVNNPIGLTFHTGNAILLKRIEQDYYNISNIDEIIQGCFVIIEY